MASDRVQEARRSVIESAYNAYLCERDGDVNMLSPRARVSRDVDVLIAAVREDEKARCEAAVRFNQVDIGDSHNPVLIIRVDRAVEAIRNA